MELEDCTGPLCTSQDEQEQDSLLRYLVGLEDFINEEIETHEL